MFHKIYYYVATSSFIDINALIKIVCSLCCLLGLHLVFYLSNTMFVTQFVFFCHKRYSRCQIQSILSAFLPFQQFDFVCQFMFVPHFFQHCLLSMLFFCLSNIMLVTQFVLENEAENINFREFLIDVNQQQTTVLDGSQIICPEQPNQLV